jgi:hypothetical protein
MLLCLLLWEWWLASLFSPKTAVARAEKRLKRLLLHCSGLLLHLQCHSLLLRLLRVGQLLLWQQPPLPERLARHPLVLSTAAG